jgi:hypothetical protein
MGILGKNLSSRYFYNILTFDAFFLPQWFFSSVRGECQFFLEEGMLICVWRGSPQIFASVSAAKSPLP